jgi:hypothetical protein
MQKKKTKYSNMKMLYQNAVYKSLNLNLSPSNSSARSGTTSRDQSLRSKGESISNKNLSGVSKIAERSTIDLKTMPINQNLSCERKFKARANK